MNVCMLCGHEWDGETGGCCPACGMPVFEPDEPAPEQETTPGHTAPAEEDAAPPPKKLSRRTKILLAALLAGVVALAAGTLNGNPGGGEAAKLKLSGKGTGEKPYQIQKAEDLGALSDIVNDGASCAGVYFVLANDIDLTEYLSENGRGYDGGRGWRQIGNEPESAFSGVFDGAGHKITGLWIERPDDPFTGLFGCTVDAELKNVSVETGKRVNGGQRAGVLVGYQKGGRIENCAAKGEVCADTAGFTFAGLLAGSGGDTEIINCSAIGEVTAKGLIVRAGGLIGACGQGRVSGCQADANVEASGKDIEAGGLAGSISSGGVNECAATGRVSAAASVEDVENDGGYVYAGGLVGWLSMNGAAEDCSASVTVTAEGYLVNAGGLVGIQLSGGNIVRCGAYGDITGYKTFYTNMGGLIGYFDGGIISDCFATGGVFAASGCLGGLIGQSHQGAVHNSYAAGHVETNAGDGGRSFNSSGGFAGAQYSTDDILGCCYDAEATGQERGVGAARYSEKMVQPKTTAEMKQQSTYEGWDFETVWYMDADYPRLRTAGRQIAGRQIVK